MKIEQLSADQVLDKLRAMDHGHYRKYRALYSSWWGGIVTDPRWMLIPLDDHMVHRGDGIFEAIKFVDKQIYGLVPHLQRLQKSASKVGMTLSWSQEELVNLISATCRASGLQNGLIRLFVSRGPGGFTTNPYESVGLQLYIAITELSPLAEEKYQQGVRAGYSTVPVKDDFFATVKSCNYLPNVLMKKEAVDTGLDFMLTLDRDGFVGEGSTENFAIVSAQGEFLVPPFDRVLRGITITRTMALLRERAGQLGVKGVRETRLSQEDVSKAQEAFVIGTTLDVLAVVQVEGRAIGAGKPGPIARGLREWILQDQKAGSGFTQGF